MRIDWQTLALQTINVLILVAILARFLFRPVVAIMDERREAAAKLLADAETEKTKAVAAHRVVHERRPALPALPEPVAAARTSAED